MPRSHTIAAVLLALLLPGCNDPEIFDDLPDAVLGEAYDAQLHSRYARDPVRYDLFDGELPDGLSLDDTGSLTGVPIGAGDYTFEVRLVDVDGNWDVAALTLTVTYDALQVFVGPVLAEEDLNGLCLDGVDAPNGQWRHHMCLPWIRVAGGGMPGQSERVVEAGLFWVGDNSIPDGGWVDDVLIRALPSDELEWSFAPGEFIPEEAAEGANSPTDAEVSGGGTFAAGDLTGPGWIQVVHAEHGAYDIEAMVVPPDFCPAPGGC